MAYKITIHDSAKRPWGVETLVTVDDEGDIFNFALCTEKTPDKAILEKMATDRTDTQKQIIANKALFSEDEDTLEARKQTLIDEIAVLEVEKSELEAK